MGKAMKAMKAMRAMKASGAAMTKGALAEALATQMDLKKSVCGKVIGTLAEIGAGEVKSTGIFTLPGLCRIKTRVYPLLVIVVGELFGLERVASNYMVYDGAPRALGSLVLAK